MIDVSDLPTSCYVFLFNISGIHTLLSILYMPRHLLSSCSRIVYHGNNIRLCTGLRSVLDLGAAQTSSFPPHAYNL